jgi:RNA polymerase sigma-70 factor (ECF subfamily)
VENIVQLSRVVRDDEAECVRLAKAGDRAVWTTWHDSYYTVLYRYAYARLGNATDAEDVASQVFLEALEGIGRYQYRGQPILAWFYGIARNLVSRRFRLRGRTAPLDTDTDYEDRLNPFEATSEERIAIYAALDRLKPEHSEVLILRFLLDLPTKQVANLIGKTEAATYSLQVRALMTMRGLLDGDARQAA